MSTAPLAAPVPRALTAMRRRDPLRMLLLGALLALLAGCGGGGSLVKPGPNSGGGKLMIDSNMEWTRIAMSRYQLWTIDGELLNRLYLIPNVRENEYIFLGARQTKRRPDGAFYKRGLRADELRDLVLDGLRASGTVNVEARNLRPDDFGGREGLRFEFTLANEEGLKYGGQAALFEHEKGLAMALFMAPSEHYYPRDAEKVAQMLDTLRMK